MSIPITFNTIKLFFTGFIIMIGAGCTQPQDSLIIYSGKGMKHAVEAASRQYEQQTGVPVSVIFAGTNSVFKTLMTSQQGDVFIPGSKRYIDKAGKLVSHSRFIAHHIPIFVVRADNPKNLKHYTDLLQPGVTIGIGDQKIAAIGQVAQSILKKTHTGNTFQHNISLKGSTVNELLEFVSNGQVDAAIVWGDMLTWNNAQNLSGIEIPATINTPKEIWAAQLSVSRQPEKAADFVKFMSTSGQVFFKKHGFNTVQ